MSETETQNTLKPLHDHFFTTDNKDAFECKLLYITSAQLPWWPVMVCVCVWVSMPPQCNKGCLAKRKCQAGDAWLIRYHGRIMYEQSSRKESEKERKRGAAIVLSLLSFLSLPTACSSSSSSFPAASFFFVCARLGIFRLPGHIMPCFLMRSCHSMGLYHLFINEFIYWFIKFNSLRLAWCLFLRLRRSIDRLPVMVRFHIPLASCSSTLLIELNASLVSPQWIHLSPSCHQFVRTWQVPSRSLCV